VGQQAKESLVMKNLLSGMWILGLMGASPILAANSDELWEVTSKMEMAGMPFPMLARTSQICMSKGQEKDPNHAVPKSKEQNCKMSDVKVSGNKSTWKMKCEGKDPMHGEGEMVRRDGTYSGKTVLHARRGDMTLVYEGKRIGACQAKG
jgi:hypothetical protein